MEIRHILVERHPPSRLRRSIRMYALIVVKEDMTCSRCTKPIPKGTMAARETTRQQVTYVHESCYRIHRNDYRKRRSIAQKS